MNSVWIRLRETICNKRGMLLSDYSVYKNNKSKVKVQCANKHKPWLVSVKSIVNQGSWCPECAGQKTPEEMWQILEKVVVERSGILHSKKEIYINANKTRVMVECKRCEHIWPTSVSNIVNSKSWCPKCAGQKTPEEMWQRLEQKISEKGGLLLSDFSEYQNSNTKVKVQCANKHKPWLVSVTSIVNQGTWCPMCKPTDSIGENIIRNWLSIIYNKQFIKVRHSWNINPYTGKCLELDCYNEELKLAVEYDGEQHHKASAFRGGIDILMDTLLRDAIKEDNCYENNIKFFRIADPKRSVLMNFEKFLEHFKKNFGNLIGFDELNDYQIKGMKRAHSKIIAKT